MAHLRGTGLGKGMVLGTVAVVRMRSGFPLIPSIPPRIVELLSRHKLTETPDVILVAEDYQTALSIADSLRWGHVVGIAAVSARYDAAFSTYPSVVNIPGLLESVQDDMLMVVDADHGIVVADPDGMAVAQYQAEYEHIKPKRRLFLDDGHLPAVTMDHRTVLTLARVSSSEEIEKALDQGADALYVPFDTEMLPARADEVEMRNRLIRLTEMGAGKPIVLSDDYAVAPMLLLEAALRTDLTVVVPPVDHLDGMGIAELGIELNEAEADCLANEAPCERPRVGIELSARYVAPLIESANATDLVERISNRNAMRIVTGVDVVVSEDNLLAMDNLVVSSVACMIPVFVNLSVSPKPIQILEDGVVQVDSILRHVVGAGVAGVIVEPGVVAATKRMIQELNASECREDLTTLLSREAV